MLTTAEITEMRATQATAMPDTVVISAYTVSSDGLGGLTETWAASGTVTGRLASAQQSGAERLIAERITDQDAWVITVPQGTTVTAKDRLAVGSRTFEVVTALPHAAWETALRVVCTEVGT